jgi:hypothetical protein
MIKTELNKWRESEYPYDLAECGCCATHHYSAVCSHPKHAEMRQEAKELGLLDLGPRDMVDNPKKWRDVVLSFRKKFAKFYERRKQ